MSRPVNELVIYTDKNTFTQNTRRTRIYTRPSRQDLENRGKVSSKKKVQRIFEVDASYILRLTIALVKLHTSYEEIRGRSKRRHYGRSRTSWNFLD